MNIIIDGDTAIVQDREKLTNLEAQVADQAIDLGPAIREARDYLRWFTEDGDSDGKLTLVAASTGHFGEAQRIVAELDQMRQAFDAHRHYKKADKERHDVLRYIIQSVFLAKLFSSEGFGSSK